VEDQAVWPQFNKERTVTPRGGSIPLLLSLALGRSKGQARAGDREHKAK
jgi:hypothetical protein